jgi:hypothetical protein
VGEVKMDTIEALCNATIGLIVSWAATFWVLGYSATGSAAITGMFFALSFARSWQSAQLLGGGHEPARIPTIHRKPWAG